MTTFLIILVQWLHILGAIAWVGGYIFATFVLWPAIFRRPAPEAHAFFSAISVPISKFLNISAQVTFWLGLLRGTWLGQIRSFETLVGTGYGHLFMTAIILTLIAVVMSARMSKKQEAWVWEGESFRAGAAQKVRRSYIIVLGLLAVVLVCMVLMGMGV